VKAVGNTNRVPHVMQTAISSVVVGHPMKNSTARSRAMTNFETIEDSQLDNVVGGLGFSLNFDTKSGLSADTPLGSIEVPSPITIAKDLLTGVTGKLGDVLVKFGNNLKGLGQLFNFS
jgi:hypothetical protein